MTKPKTSDERVWPESIRARQGWLAVLAQASRADLEEAWAGLGIEPDYSFPRRPEIGLVMVRARAGGNGRQFNLGETTVTRCTLALAGGPVGTGYILGRDPRKAELVALLDALLQDPARRDLVAERVIGPLRDKAEAAETLAARKTAATKVDFFTMVRGED